MGTPRIAVSGIVDLSCPFRARRREAYPWGADWLLSLDRYPDWYAYRQNDHVGRERQQSRPGRSDSRPKSLKLNRTSSMPCAIHIVHTRPMHMQNYDHRATLLHLPTMWRNCPAVPSLPCLHPHPRNPGFLPISDIVPCRCRCSLVSTHWGEMGIGRCCRTLTRLPSKNRPCIFVTQA